MYDASAVREQVAAPADASLPPWPCAEELMSSGRLRTVRRGESLEGVAAGLSIVSKGVACLTDSASGLCLAIIGPKVPLAPPAADCLIRPRSGFWMTDGEVLDLSLPELSDLPRDTFLGMIDAMTRRHCAALAVESVCARRHQAAPRLARWLLRLFDDDAQAVVVIDQTVLAGMAGLQRTSVCAAMVRLQKTGALKVTRGRVLLRNRSALSDIACPCGAHEPG